MRRILPLFLVLFCISFQSKADCDPSFTFTSQSDQVQVQASNTAPHLYHSWRTDGSGYFAYGPSATLHFYMPGTFYIVHRVVDSITHCEDSVRQTVVVSFPVNCDAEFIATRDSVNWTTYTFRSTSTYSGGDIGYEWKIDGVVISYNQSFSSLLYFGTHNICLTVHTTAGCTSSICKPMLVTDVLSCHLPASFTATASPSNPKQISFVGSPSGDSLTYRWSFADGFTSNQQNPVHVYSNAGIYNVRFMIYDTINGCFDTIFQNVQVHGLPSDSCTGAFSYGILVPDVNVFEFYPESNQPIVSQNWWITKENALYDSIHVDQGSFITYTFANAGYYSVCMLITTSTGCHARACDSIHIDTIPNPSGGRIPSYPNPATNTVNVRIHLDQGARMSVTVYNMLGYAVYRTDKVGHSGGNEISIPVQQFTSGQYFIDIQYGNQRKRSTFQKF